LDFWVDFPVNLGAGWRGGGNDDPPRPAFVAAAAAAAAPRPRGRLGQTAAGAVRGVWQPFGSHDVG